MPSFDPDDWNDDLGCIRYQKMGGRRPGERAAGSARPKRRANERGDFKCGHCRAFVGPTVCGGRHRNHCPLCLASRHVDRSRPGDRESDCGGMMPAVGTFHRLDGEQMLLHRCNRCGMERHNRIAADDNPIALLRLAVVQPRRGRRAPDAANADEAVA